MSHVVKNIKLVNEADIADTSNWANIANLKDKEYPGKIGIITGYEYALLGNRVKEVASRAYAFTESDSVNRELHTVTFSYDALNRLLALTRKHEGADVQIIYGYDEEGNRSWTRNERGDTTQFSYDGVNRLISMTDAEGGTFSYTYDLAGNMHIYGLFDRMYGSLSQGHVFSQSCIFGKNRIHTGINCITHGNRNFIFTSTQGELPLVSSPCTDVAIFSIVSILSNGLILHGMIPTKLNAVPLTEYSP